MVALRTVLAEIFHLFVDDGSLALALMAWCAVVGAGVAVLPALTAASGLALFVGCAVILLGNISLAARRRAGTGRGP